MAFKAAVGGTASAAVFSVIPTGPVDFGSVNIGNFADQVFIVQNTGDGTVSGAASVSAPFRIVSGSPFKLVGPGATQSVTVRFAPTEPVAASTSINFATDGDTVSELITGVGILVDATTVPATTSTGAPRSKRRH
jgi:hypothetical protein